MIFSCDIQEDLIFEANPHVTQQMTLTKGPNTSQTRPLLYN